MNSSGSSVENKNIIASRAGILGLEKLIEVKRPYGTVVLIPKIDVLLDLSVNGEEVYNSAIPEIINSHLEKKVTDISRLCADITKTLLKKYEIAKRAEVKMEAEYAVYRKTPISRKKTQEMYKILSRAISENGKTRKMIGAEITGTTSCPCAQEGLGDYAREVLKGEFSKEEIEKIINTIPMASHSQRNVSRLLIEVPEEYEVEADELIDIIEGSVSSRMYGVLKRVDEIEVVIKAHRNPMFVEDVVRKILKRVVQRFSELPDNTAIFVKSESQESIHQHNGVAERSSTLGELRKELNG